jgi:hypothetical protein
MLDRTIQSLPACAVMWSMAITLILADDAAMLAIMFC